MLGVTLRAINSSHSLIPIVDAITMQHRQLHLQFSSIPPEDRISALPDVLNLHILYFLPTKDAAATIILSKRWKPLWFSQFRLKLDDQNIPDPSIFREIPNSFITNRDQDLPICSFHLICRHNHYNKTDFTKILYPVVQRRVPNLSIDLSLSALPTCVLNNEFLSVLKLTRLLLDEIPNVKLPSLKFLRLESVTFTHYNYLTNILSACPILEELETKDLNVETNYRVAHPTPQFPYILQGGLSKLVRANISGWHIMYSFLNNAKHLQLHVVFPYEPYNMFHNLTHLEITFDVAPNISMLKWDWLIFVLAKFPKLQTLIIDEVDTVTNSSKAEDWYDPKIVPECLLTHLTTCSLRNYSSINWELPFAKYIMQNSRVLSTMTIQVAKSIDSDAKLQIVKELSLCPKNSATCELLII
ncbi:hypothetical protein OROMI_009089 [Orobanche minor]